MQRVNARVGMVDALPVTDRACSILAARLHNPNACATGSAVQTHMGDAPHHFECACSFTWFCVGISKFVLWCRRCQAASFCIVCLHLHAGCCTAHKKLDAQETQQPHQDVHRWGKVHGCQGTLW